MLEFQTLGISVAEILTLRNVRFRVFSPTLVAGGLQKKRCKLYSFKCDTMDLKAYVKNSKHEIFFRSLGSAMKFVKKIFRNC